jgi:hypothetical protein
MLLSHALRAASIKAPSVQYIGSAYTDTNGAGANNYSQPVPSGLSGDLLIYIGGCQSDVAYTVPSPWIELRKTSTSSGRSTVYYKVATSNSESNFRVDISLSRVVGGVVLRFRNVDTVFAGSYSEASSVTTVTAPEVSATTNDYVLQCFISGASLRVFSVPTVSTGTIFTDSNSSQPSISVFYQLNGSNNATSTTSGGGTSALNGIQIRLRP